MTAIASPSAAPANVDNKVRFVVINENMFGYVDPRLPLSAGVLQSKPSRGANFFWMDGSYPLRADGKDVRPATRADFEDYRIRIEPYERDAAHYLVPAA